MPNPKTLLLFIVLPFFLSYTNAQSNENERPEWFTEPDFRVNLSTPYHTLRTHLLFLQPESYDADKAAQAFMHPELGPEEARDYAIRLKQVFDGKGYYIELEAAPNDAYHTDTVHNEHIYIPHATCRRYI